MSKPGAANLLAGRGRAGKGGCGLLPLFAGGPQCLGHRDAVAGKVAHHLQRAPAIQLPPAQPRIVRQAWGTAGRLLGCQGMRAAAAALLHLPTFPPSPQGPWLCLHPVVACKRLLRQSTACYLAGLRRQPGRGVPRLQWCCACQQACARMSSSVLQLGTLHKITVAPRAPSTCTSSSCSRAACAPPPDFGHRSLRC